MGSFSRIYFINFIKWDLFIIILFGLCLYYLLYLSHKTQRWSEYVGPANNVWGLYRARSEACVHDCVWVWPSHLHVLTQFSEQVSRELERIMSENFSKWMHVFVGWRYLLFGSHFYACSPSPAPTPTLNDTLIDITISQTLHITHRLGGNAKFTSVVFLSWSGY